jgi:hypothetical protein
MKGTKQLIPFLFLISLVSLLGAFSVMAQESEPATDSATYRLFMPPALLQNGNFEAGRTGWTEFSAKGYALIVTQFAGSIRAHSGSWAAWLGGDNSETSVLSQQVMVPANASYLTYWHWIASADLCGYDRLDVRVNGAVRQTYFLCRANETPNWRAVSVDLAAFSGQRVNLEFRVVTDGSLNSNLFIDDVSFQSNPAALGDVLYADPADEGLRDDAAQMTK